MFELLSETTGVDEPLRKPEQTMAELRRLVRETGDEWNATPEHSKDPESPHIEGMLDCGERWGCELMMVRDAIALRAALTTITCVGNAFAVDGSISFTHGPEYPASIPLGLRGNDYGELHENPSAVLEAARTATRALATVVAWSQQA
jgi:hypothetical protein